MARSQAAWSPRPGAPGSDGRDGRQCGRQLCRQDWSHPAACPRRRDRDRGSPDPPAGPHRHQGQPVRPDRAYRVDRRPVALPGQARGHAGPGRRARRVPGDPVPPRRQPGGADQPGAVAADRADAGDRRRALGGRTARRRAAHPRHHPAHQRDGRRVGRACAGCSTTSPP